MESIWLECLKAIIVYFFELFHNQRSLIDSQTESICRHFRNRLIIFFNMCLLRQSFKERLLLWKPILLIFYLLVLMSNLIIIWFLSFAEIDNRFDKLRHLSCSKFLLYHFMQINRNKEHYNPQVECYISRVHLRIKI